MSVPLVQDDPAARERRAGRPDLLRARRQPRRRLQLLVAALSVVLLLLTAARVLLGDYTVTVPDFLRIVTGTDIPGASWIVLETKLPRAVLAVLTGFAFGVAGAVFQTTLRNPLASPDILGVSSGAGAAAAIGIVLIGLDGGAVSLCAIAGAVITAAAVRWVAGSGAGYRLVLVGVGTAAALQAVVQYVFTRANEYDAQLVLRWLTGSVSGADWPAIGLLAGALSVLLPSIGIMSRSMRILELGPDTAAALGVPRGSVDGLLLLAVVLTACAVAAAGPIAFVAFLAAPIARALNQGRATLLAAGLTGAAIAVGADYAADYLLADINFPVGVVTGAFGAPFLLWLLATGRTGRRAA